MADSFAAPTGAVDEFEVLFAGYAPEPAPWQYGTVGGVAFTVSFLRDGDRRSSSTPGSCRAATRPRPARRARLPARGPHRHRLQSLAPRPRLHAALFPSARLTTRGGSTKTTLGCSAYAEGYQVSPGVALMQTPGHTDQAISTLAATHSGLVVFTHSWWADARPPEAPPLDTDYQAFQVSRDRILWLDPALIVLGHGAPFPASVSTPR